MMNRISTLRVAIMVLSVYYMNMSSETGRPTISEEDMKTTKYSAETAAKEEEKAAEEKLEEKQPEQPQEETPTEEPESEGADGKSLTEEERKARISKQKSDNFYRWVAGKLKAAFTGGKSKTKA